MDSKRLKDEPKKSKVENNRAPTKAKTGGRQPGTPNKKTQLFADALDAAGFDIATAIVNLFDQTNDEYIKLSLIGLALKYRVPIPKPKEHPEDDQMVIEVNTPISTENILKITNGQS